ncbi:MAG: DUF3800 domain-containing protein, partial [bacterium]|nr:DUF3800 domain-containing protein [bacterium]
RHLENRDFSQRGVEIHVIGLQIADLCAYPLARHLLNPKEPYIPFKVIEKKIYGNKDGGYEGRGLKMLP